ncbi:MAG: flagellar assembly protein T N-terminal domain-containing protein, partial [Azonexus sp.]|nr:flagellar assembly protein T N-terminal domain-containing protein [Azonexus sp.]
LTFRKLFFLILFFSAPPILANNLIVEGSAPIINGDVGQARELAMRRAISRASEQKSANVSSNSVVRNNVVYETVQLRTAACAENVEQVSERVNGNELTVVMKVTIREGTDCLPSCRGAYTNRVVVTGFAMEFPEQKLDSEPSRLSQMTAIELSRKLRKRSRLLTDFNSRVFPYVSPSRAPEPYLTSTDTETRFSALSKSFRAQYVLAGVYRDFTLKGPYWFPNSRRIEIEAFIHDAINGEVIARRSFSQEAFGSVLIKSSPAIGTEEFYQGDLGKVWGSILEDIAAWTELQAACLPFSSRVIKVSGKEIHIDSGAESGLSAGDTLNLHNWKEPPIYGMNGLLLGKEKRISATASIRAVYPRFSVIEISNFPAGLQVKPGDILYAQ